MIMMMPGDLGDTPPSSAAHLAQVDYLVDLLETEAYKAAMPVVPPGPLEVVDGWGVAIVIECHRIHRFFFSLFYPTMAQRLIG